MSIIKSFSVGNGDMFYIDHNSDNFSIIDCNLIEKVKVEILNEISYLNKEKGITRVISTHPDKDHITGLKELNDEIDIRNFYCVDNNISCDDVDEDFKEYCNLRDSNKAFYIYKGCTRLWMNQTDDERGSSGIFILWPDVNNDVFKDELEKIENDEKDTPNNISPIIHYSLENGVDVLWFGDIEKDFLEKIIDDVNLPKADIIFAPHHGRDSGKIPKNILDEINPKIIVIGEAESNNLNYYNEFNTITQKSSGNIVFECVSGKVHVYTGNGGDYDFLKMEYGKDSLKTGEIYVGTLKI